MFLMSESYRRRQHHPNRGIDGIGEVSVAREVRYKSYVVSIYVHIVIKYIIVIINVTQRATSIAFLSDLYSLISFGDGYDILLFV
jgi:hypothetical protein